MLTVELVRTDGTRMIVGHSDAVLYQQHNTYDDWSPRHYKKSTTIHAFSVLGPEQAIRALGAACSEKNNHAKPSIRFIGHKTTIDGHWDGEWSHRSVLVRRGLLHMVAMPEIRLTRDVAKADTGSGGLNSQPNQLCVSPDGTEAGLIRTIYERLQLCFTTPLIPAETPNQNPIEAEAGLAWRAAIVRALLFTHHWSELMSHPEQPDTRWANAGILSLCDSDLDNLVSSMLYKGALTIPELEAAPAVA